MSAKIDTQDPIERYNTLLASNEFLFIVFYRGHWCPFCRAFIATLQSIAPAITAAGGKAVTITSEPLEYLDTMRNTTGWSGEGISDPENKLVQYFKERNMVDVAVTVSATGVGTGGRTYYTHGMAQPAILAVRKNGEVLENWAIVPSVMNVGGMKDRPDLNEVFENVRAKLNGEKQVHAKYSTGGICKFIKGFFV